MKGYTEQQLDTMYESFEKAIDVLTEFHAVLENARAGNHTKGDLRAGYSLALRCFGEGLLTIEALLYRKHPKGSRA